MKTPTETYVKWGLMFFGALTMTMIGAVIAPSAMLQMSFGVAVTDPLALLIVRSWGALIALMGAMLIYAALHPGQRGLSVAVVMASKIIFLGLLMLYGQNYLRAAAGVIATDTLAVLFLAACLMRPRMRA